MSVCVYVFTYVQLDVLLTRKCINHTVSTYHKFWRAVPLCGNVKLKAERVWQRVVVPLSMPFSQLYWHLIYCCDMARMHVSSMSFPTSSHLPLLPIENWIENRVQGRKSKREREIEQKKRSLNLCATEWDHLMWKLINL